MKALIQPAVMLITGCFFLFTGLQSATAQYSMPAVMDTARLEEQLDYIQERTRIYNDYRAVREDLFQRMKNNTMDTVNQARTVIGELRQELEQAEQEIEALNADLERVREERDEAIRTKDSLSFLGIQMNKILYNTIMWVLVLVLLGLAGILFLLFKRSHVVTLQTKKELDNTKEEFETYRKNAREKYEKLVVSHHNEIMKLKKG
jgi:hypothetical protein